MAEMFFARSSLLTCEVVSFFSVGGVLDESTGLSFESMLKIYAELMRKGCCSITHGKFGICEVI